MGQWKLRFPQVTRKCVWVPSAVGDPANLSCSPLTYQGEKRIIPKGQVFFVEDISGDLQHSFDFIVVRFLFYLAPAVGKGHFSRSVEGKERRSIFIPVTDEFDPNQLLKN